MRDLEISETIESVRKFNRFYTKHIGILNEGLLESRFSLAEARVLYEIANRESPTATEIGTELNLTKGYLSRILSGLDKFKLIEKIPSQKDSRQSILTLTEKGRTEFARLDRMSREQIENLLGDVTLAGQYKLLDSMSAIEQMLGTKDKYGDRSFLFRTPEPGDFGWVVQANGRLYADEYGWDATYEALVAQIVADFVTNFDAKKERGWIVEENGENIASVFLVKSTDEIAKLRMLIVDPKARGMGIGKGLVDRCTRFARQAGYKKITLWTNSILLAARGIYEQAGYIMTKSEAGHMFGHDLISETWELIL